MKLVELYSGGNIKNDIEPENKMRLDRGKSTATQKYDCDKYTKEYNELYLSRCSAGLFIKNPEFKEFNAPWNK